MKMVGNFDKWIVIGFIYLYNRHMPRLLVLFLLSVFFFLAFVLFSYLVHENLFTQFDFNTTVRMQDNFPRRFDGLFSWFSVIGDFQYMLIAVVFVCLIFRKFLASFVAFCMFGFFHVIELFGKNYVEHFPPPEFMLRTERPIDFHPFYVRSEFSYPSGHAGRTVFLASLLIVMILMSNLSKPVKYLLIGFIGGFTFLMILSRPYLGEHWATDVIGGALLGASFGLFSALFFDKRLSLRNIPKLFSSKSD